MTGTLEVIVLPQPSISSFIRWKLTMVYKKGGDFTIIFKLKIKPLGLGFRIRDVEAFWYKTEIKIIVFDCMVNPDSKFLI